MTRVMHRAMVTSCTTITKASRMRFKTPDLLDNNEARIQAGSVRIVAPMFRHYGGRSAFCGQVVTLKLFEDNSLVREVLAEDGRGQGPGD
jgi:regulator of ribonuclease activity A